MSLDHHELMLRALLAGEKYGLTTEDILALQEAAHAVYEEIASDLAVGCEYDHEVPFRRPRQVDLADRETVIEASLDADRPLGELLWNRSRTHLSPRLEECLKDHLIDYEDLKELVGPAFMYEEYEIGG